MQPDKHAKYNETMAIVKPYTDTTEAHLYWNLLKDLSETVKVQLFIKLKNSLLSKDEVSTDKDAQAAYYSILEKLRTYQGYGKGWDGENASPLTEKVIGNFTELLEVIDKQLLKGITIFPEVNGTLLIDSTKREAGISLGDEKFSYYEIVDDKVIGENALPFSIPALTKAISRINR